MPQRLRQFVVCLASLALAATGFLGYWHRRNQSTIRQTTPTAAREKRVAKADAQQVSRVMQAVKQLPLSFEEDTRATGGSKRFVSRGPAYTLGVTGSGATLVRKFHTAADNASAMPLGTPFAGVSNFQFSWVGANEHAKPAALDRQTGESNFFPSTDRRTWRRHVAHYGKVQVANLYPGVNLVFHGANNQLEFDYVVAPRADASAIRIGIGTPSIVGLNKTGQVEIQKDGDELFLQPPVAYQEIAGVRKPVPANYVLAESHEVQLSLGPYDKKHELVIDPVLAFAAHFGSSSNLSIASDVKVDASGNIYLTGTTCDVDYPVTQGALQTSGGSITANLCFDGIVTKLNASASALVYSTYFGSANNVTAGFRILPLTSGAVLVAGATTALDFPTTAHAFQATASGGTCTYGQIVRNAPCADSFVFELSADGSSLVFSTYLGGNGADIVSAMTTDSSGNIYVAGGTTSSNFPVTSGVVDSTYGGGTCTGSAPCPDAFVSKLSSDGSQLLESTYLGGNDDDFASSIVVDSSGNIYVDGATCSTNFPVTSGALKTTHAASPEQGDAFVTKLAPDMKSLIYSTYLGGSDVDMGLALRVDSSGSAYVTGATISTDFPTTSGAFQTSYAGPSMPFCAPSFDSSLLSQPSCGDIFVSKLNPTGTALIYSTYIGGSGRDISATTTLDSSNNLWLLADTDSTDFPLSADTYFSIAGSNVVLMELSADGKSLPFATPLVEGSAGEALAMGIQIDSSGVYVGGQATTYSPTPGTFTSGTNPSIFVAEFTPGTARPVIQLSTNTVTFPGQVTPIGSSSAPQTVTLTNTGNAPLNLSISLSAGQFSTNALAFSESDNCGTTVAATASCTIALIYQPQPTSTAGDGAQLKILSNAPHAPHIIGISGSSGNADSASFVPSTLTFNGQAPGTTSPSQTVGIQTAATGTTSLLAGPTGSPVKSGPNASDFNVDPTNCQAGTHFCTLSVTFAPSVSSTGTETASVSVPTFAPNSPQVLNLVGNVSSGPFAMIFPVFINPTVVGQTFNGTVSIKNTGGTTLTVTNVTSSGPNTGDFVPSNTNCGGYPAFSLASGASCGLNLAFTPSANGTRSATFTFSDNETSPASFTVTGYGSQSNGPAFSLLETPSPTNGQILYPDTVVGTQGTFSTVLVSLLNVGSGAGQVTSATLTGDFSQTNNCPATIPASNNCTYTVTFAPTQAGLRTGTLTIVTNAPGGQTFTVNFDGNGVTIPKVSVVPSSVNFGQEAIGSPSAAQTITLSNPGNGALNLANIAITGPFSQTTTCGASLAAQASCTFSVKFTPAGAGPASGTLSFTDNGAGGGFAAGLSGQGVTGASIEAIPSSLTFGTQAEGTQSAPQTITLMNAGTTGFTLNGFQTTENYASSNNCPASLTAGASCTITVKFAPGSDTFANFPATGAIYVTNSAPGSPLYIPLNGTAGNSTGAATTPTVVSSQNPSTIGQSVTFTATVTSSSPGTPTGAITFMDSSTPLGTVTMNGGHASLTTSTLSAGNHSIFVQYSGDSTFAPSTSSGILQTVQATTGTVATTTTISASANPSTTGQSITFTAGVSSTTPGAITGTVTFMDGSTTIGSPAMLSGGSASVSTSTLTAGAHSITAHYGGDSTFTASTSTALSLQVNAAANQDFSVTANPTSISIAAGQSGTTQLAVTPIQGSTQTVTFGCSGLPRGTTCTFSSVSVMLDGTHMATSTLTIQTQGNGQLPAARMRSPNAPLLLLGYVLLCLGATLTIWLLMVSWQRPLSPVALGLAVTFIALGLVACGGGSSGSPAGTSTVTVTATAGSDTHSVPVSLTVTTP